MREMPRYVDRGLFAGCAFCKIGSNGPKQYNPKRFAAVIMRIREPKTTALIFASGKMVVTGAKSEDDSKLASRKYARIIQKLGFNAKFTDFKIQNIVGSCDIKFPIRLEGLASKHHNFSSYEPELFPGLIYRMIKPKIVLLIFVSGKIVLTGAKVREEIYQAFEMIYPVLQGQSPVWMVYILFTCANSLQISERSKDTGTSCLRRPTSHAPPLITTTCNIPQPNLSDEKHNNNNIPPKKSSVVAALVCERRAGVFGCCIICHFFPSAALHRRSGMEITGRTRSMGVHHIDCAWDRRRSAQGGGNVRRSVAVLIPQHGEEELHGRRLNRGPGSGQGDCDCSQANLANQPIDGAAPRRVREA